MQTIVYTDLERLTSLPIGKTAWIENGERRWKRSSATFRFIVLRNEDPIIIIAPVLSHIELFLLHEARNFSPEKASNVLMFTNRGAIPRSNLIGAGAVSDHGEITNWDSLGFQIRTPFLLRPKIKRSIAGLFFSGELKAE